MGKHAKLSNYNSATFSKLEPTTVQGALTKLYQVQGKCIWFVWVQSSNIGAVQ